MAARKTKQTGHFAVFLEKINFPPNWYIIQCRSPQDLFLQVEQEVKSLPVQKIYLSGCEKKYVNRASEKFVYNMVKHTGSQFPTQLSLGRHISNRRVKVFDPQCAHVCDK